MGSWTLEMWEEAANDGTPLDAGCCTGNAGEADARASAHDGVARRRDRVFALSMTSRSFMLQGPGEVASGQVAQLGVQIAAIAAFAAILGLGIAMGVTTPVRRVTEQLEALASGDLRGALDIASTSELDSLGGAFNEAITALQRWISASYMHQGSGPGGARDVVGVMIAFKDLNQMRAIKARLQQADQLMALGTVTAGVAHEIRNPLASLRGLAELLRRDTPPGDNRRRYVDTMLQSIDRLNRLIEDLLLFSSPRAAEVDDLDLSGTASETVTLAAMGIGDRPVSVRWIRTDDRLVVRGNRGRLIQVLTNIVLNAVQATPDGGAVTVSAGQRDGSATVTVHNTGSYIPPDVRRQLFVPFFTTKPTGTGLGLAIARQIVMSMDGRIDVESDRDWGTTFTVELPLAVRAPAAAVA